VAPKNKKPNMPFQEIPILDLSLARDEATKPAFLQDLLDALLNVGFLYIKNTGIDQSLFDKVCEEGIRFFDLPEEEKLRIEMKNAQSFLGYSKVLTLSSEIYLLLLTRMSSSATRSQHPKQTGGNRLISALPIPSLGQMRQPTTICLLQINGQKPS
jgi:isopenicillin N synthase-like dioxygenase